MRLVTLTHPSGCTLARHGRHGQVYQGRFKSFVVVQDDRHFVAVARYVEANALNGDLVQRAEPAGEACGSCGARGGRAAATASMAARAAVPDWITYVNRRRRRRRWRHCAGALVAALP